MTPSLLAWRPHPQVVAIVATVCAAGLVLFLQHRAISALESQNQVILRQISELTAGDIATELRQILDGPVFDTLTAVNHPELRAGRLDLVAEQYTAGLRAYPQVDRFFVWHADTERTAPGEVLFYDRDGSFARDPALGRAVIALARQHAPAQQIYAAAEGLGPDERHQVFLRLFWSDARRVEYFAVLGFVIDRVNMRERLFDALRARHLDALLTRRGGSLPLRLRVLDESGALVYGETQLGALGGRVEFPVLFYPSDEIQSRLAAGVAPKQWTIEVTAPPSAGRWASATSGYGPTALSIILMVVALGLAVNAQRRSADLARMQADFVAHVSHQLKTPLSLLSTATETLQMDRIRSPERFSEYLTTIHAEAARLSLLIQRVLEFSRVQQQRSYELEQVDLGALVRETVDAFAHTLSNQHFSIDVEQRGASPIVLADPAALEQVLANLLDNAVKYSAAVKQIRVCVSSSRHDAIVEVVDRGVGIAPKDQRHVFERFYRTSSTHSRPGFGLGLSIVRELVHAHHGRVELSSVVGEGSTFRVVLPRQTADVRVEEPRTVAPKAAS